MVDYKEIKLVKDGEECVPFAPNKADKTGIDNLVITKASKLELETAVEELSESIPSKVSELENDIPYLSTTEASNAYATKAELSSSVNDLTNIKASKMELETAVDELDTKIDLKQDKTTAVTHTANTVVGSNTHPIYVNSDGEVVQCSFPTNSLSTVATNNMKLYLAGGGSQGTYVTGRSNINNFIDTDNTLNTVTAPDGDSSTKVATTEFVSKKVEVPIGTIIQSSVDITSGNFKHCDGSRIEDYDNQLNTNKTEPVLYRLYNMNTQNFHQHIFTTDKDICKKVNPDVSTLYRPIRNNHDCYGMNSTGYVRINQNEEISMRNGVITSKSGFYDGEFQVYNNSLQILTIFAENYKRAYIEYIPFFDTYRLLNTSVSQYNKIACHENVIVIIDGNNVEYSLDDETFTSINDINETSIYSVYCFNGLFVITTLSSLYFTYDVTGEWSKINNPNKISNIAYDGNYFVGVSNDNSIYYTSNIQVSDMWTVCTVFDEDTVQGKFDNIVVFKNHFIATFNKDNYKCCLYSTPCIEIDNSNILWNKYEFNCDCNIGKLKVVNDTLFALNYKKYINRYNTNGVLSLNTIYTTFYASDFLNFKELPGDFTCYDAAYSNGTFLFCTSADILVKNVTGIPITTSLSTPETKAQELQDCTEHNYIQQLDGQYKIDCVSKHNDENVRIYSAADTDITVSDNSWLTNAVDGKYLNIGEYNYTTAKWVQTSLIYSGNINSTAGSTNNKICLEFDFITPPTFVAARDIFYAYRTLIFRVADVNGNLNMYMAGYNSSGLKWRYSNKSTGITLDTNTKYHLKFETTGFSTTSPYYTYTLSITPYNILDSTLLENRTQTHTFSLAYLPYNYYSNSATNSMSSIYCADASAWTVGQMLDLRSFKLTWNDHTTYALNNTTKYSDCYNSGLYAPYMKDSHIRIK